MEALLEARWFALQRFFFFEITAPTGPPRVKTLTTALEEGLLLAQGRPVGQRTTSNLNLSLPFAKVPNGPSPRAIIKPGLTAVIHGKSQNCFP